MTSSTWNEYHQSPSGLVGRILKNVRSMFIAKGQLSETASAKIPGFEDSEFTSSGVFNAADRHSAQRWANCDRRALRTSSISQSDNRISDLLRNPDNNIQIDKIRPPPPAMFISRNFCWPVLGYSLSGKPAFLSQ